MGVLSSFFFLSGWIVLLFVGIVFTILSNDALWLNVINSKQNTPGQAAWDVCNYQMYPEKSMPFFDIVG
jgi:hypothetical protein